MINPLSSSLAGMMAATKKLDSAATTIATASPDTDSSGELIKTLEAKNAYQANAVVLSRTKDMQKELGRLFDETA